MNSKLRSWIAVWVDQYHSTFVLTKGLVRGVTPSSSIAPFGGVIVNSRSPVGATIVSEVAQLAKILKSNSTSREVV